MQPDPARVAETREWFAKAALDLRAAEFEFTSQPPLTADIVFHAQQLADHRREWFILMLQQASAVSDAVRDDEPVTDTASQIGKLELTVTAVARIEFFGAAHDSVTAVAIPQGMGNGPGHRRTVAEVLVQCVGNVIRRGTDGEDSMQQRL